MIKRITIIFVLFINVHNSFGKLIESSSLIGNPLIYYPLDSNSDNSSNSTSNNGKCKDIIFKKDSTRGMVAFFNGNNSYIDCGNLKPPNKFTISVWVKPLDMKKYYLPIVGIENAFWIRTTIDNKLQFSEDSLGYYFSNGFKILKSNQWQNIAVSYDNGEKKISFYVNGKKTNTINNKSGDFNYHNNTLKIGNDRWRMFYNGYMDDIYIYDTILSDNEIASLYKKTYKTPKLSSNLQLYLPLNSSEKFYCGEKPKFTNIDFKYDNVKDKVAYFNGKDSYISCNKINLNREFSVSVWIKPETISEDKSAILGDNSFSLRTLSPGNVLFTSVWYNDFKSYNSIISTDKWHHIVATFKTNDSLKIYVNNNLSETFKTGDIGIPATEMMIGSNIWKNYFHGSISELAIWDRIIGKNEIDELYKGVKPLNIKRKKLSSFLIYLSVLLAITILIVIYFSVINRKKKSQKNLNNFLVHLFGEFTVINSRGIDITHKFSPILKQLFIFILLKTINNKKGVTSDEITELLWYDYPTQKAKNNRGVNINKLRHILDEIQGIELKYDNKYWKIEFTNNSIDYMSYLNLIKHHTISLNILNQIKNIIGKGNLLEGLNFEWLDDFKAKTSDTIIDRLTTACNDSKSLKFKYEVSNLIILFDSVNDNALEIQIRYLRKKGKHSQARLIYNNFCKKYKRLYDEPYKRFEDIL